MDPHPTREGLLGENEFYKTVLLDSGWAIEPRRPSPADDQVDFLIHLPGRPTELILVQIKTAFELHRQGRARMLSIRFGVKTANVFTHPRFWYFFAHFDVVRRTFQDPLFLVPSTLLSQGATSVRTDRVHLHFDGNMEDDAADQWVPYRTSMHGIGKRIEQIFANLPAESMDDRLAWKRFMEEPTAA
jgi:hypothetical protein